MKFIHYKCVKTWLEHHLSCKPSALISSYYWKTFECEICRREYPFCLSHAGNKYYLIDIAIPAAKNYIFLESLNKDKIAARAIHILLPTSDHNLFKLGRGHESNIRIADISVSRVHATLKVQPDGLFLEDNSSKFGTLVLVKEAISLEQGTPRSLQAGRTLLWCCLKHVAPLAEK